MDQDVLRREIAIAFEYSYEHDDWVTPLEEALDGITAQEALWKPAPKIPSIWEIVLHVAVWNENIVERMAQRTRGERPGHPAEGAWPPLPAVQDEAAWEAAQNRLRESLSQVRTHIETMSLPAVVDYGSIGYSHLDDLLCRFLHNAYHIGQITKLREWRTAAVSGE